MGVGCRLGYLIDCDIDADNLWCYLFVWLAEFNDSDACLHDCCDTRYNR